MPTLEEWKTKAGEAEWSLRLESKLKEYHHLITREAAEYLIRLEVEGVKAQARTLKDAAAGFGPSMLRARVERVFPPRIIDRSAEPAAPGAPAAPPPRTPVIGASLSRIQRAALSDHTGTGTLVAYDAAALPLEQEVLMGDLIEAGPVRLRNGEFQLMPGGAIRLIQAGGRSKLAGREPAIGHFSGRVAEFLGDHAFRRYKQTTLAKPAGAPGGADGANAAEAQGLMTAFSIEDGTGRVRAVLWDSPGLQGVLAPGMAVQVENGVRRGEEIHLNSSSRLVFRPRDEQGSRPLIESVELTPQRLVVRAQGGRQVEFSDLAVACRRLGAGTVPEGVSPLTILEMKAKEWVGKPLPARWEDGGAHP